MAVCHCDMFPADHEAGTVSADGKTECETTLRPTGPMISPHMFPEARFANDPVE
jgi:hypothetical protein